MEVVGGYYWVGTGWVLLGGYWVGTIGWVLDDGCILTSSVLKYNRYVAFTLYLYGFHFFFTPMSDLCMLIIPNLVLLLVL